MTIREQRELGTIEIRDRGAGAVPSIVGYAAVFDSETVIANAFREVVRPGAFARALREGQDVVAWYRHGAGAVLPLGRTSAGTLQLREDTRGLYYEIDPPDTPSARELIQAIQRGDVAGSSFMFRVPSSDGERWTEADPKTGKLPLRELLDVDLYDVSPVVRPAYPETAVALRTAEEVLQAYLASRPASGDAVTADDELAAQQRALLLAIHDQVEIEALNY